MDQVPNRHERKIIAAEAGDIPVNPYNNRRDIVQTNCQDICDCKDEAGYLYNPHIWESSVIPWSIANAAQHVSPRGMEASRPPIVPANNSSSTQ